MILYLDCIGGVAGDMVLAALVDAGAPLSAINDELAKLQVPGLTVHTRRVERHSIDSCNVTVTWNTKRTDDHPHRPYAEIRDLVASAGFAVRVRTRALAVFRRLAEVEGRIHGIDPDDVHFHEVGSEDSIADVVGVAVALELLDVDDIRCSPLPIGRGFVRSAHGVVPLPAPATLELIKGIPVEGVDIDLELVTPTGAAIVAALSSTFGGFPSMTPMATGYGAGGRDLPQRPNVVRAVLGVPSPTRADGFSGRTQGQVVVIETNLDDLSPELVPDASAAAMLAGALDVWTTPAFMKKGRPGFVLSALTRHEHAEAVADALLAETSALGVRMSTYDRVELERTFVLVDVGSHPVSVKLGLRDGKVVNVAPEHDDCAAVAFKLGRPVKEVYARALTAAVSTHHV